MSTFWDDLAADLEDPEFRAAYEAASEQIAAEDARRNAEAAS